MGYWQVDESRTFTDVDDLCDYIFDTSEYDDDDAVREYIDECYSDCRTEIAGYDFSASEIVENCSEDLFNDMRAEWAEHQAEWDRDDWYSTLDRMEDGDREYINGYTIEYFDDDYEDEDDEEEIDEEEEIVVKTLMDHFQKLA